MKQFQATVLYKNNDVVFSTIRIRISSGIIYGTKQTILKLNITIVFHTKDISHVFYNLYLFRYY